MAARTRQQLPNRQGTVTMRDFAMLLKSHRDDYQFAQRLLGSFQAFNMENIHLYCVVPESDLELFQQFESANLTVLSEALLGDYLVDKALQGVRPGYINQEIVKLAFWELEETQNYFCIDSDAEFIRPFRVNDFMFDQHTPFTVLVEDQDLRVDPWYFSQHGNTRDKSLDHIRVAIELDLPYLRTCHGHQIMSSAVLRSFKTDFLDPRGWSYSDVLAIEPYEFTWYNLWLQKTEMIPIHQREPLVKVFHTPQHHLEQSIRGLTVEDYARGYLAVVVNSNFSRDQEVTQFSSSRPHVLAEYLSLSELLRSLAVKLQMAIHPRVKR